MAGLEAPKHRFDKFAHDRGITYFVPLLRNHYVYIQLFSASQRSSIIQLKSLFLPLMLCTIVAIEIRDYQCLNQT